MNEQRHVIAEVESTSRQWCRTGCLGVRLLRSQAPTGPSAVQLYQVLIKTDQMCACESTQ